MNGAVIEAVGAQYVEIDGRHFVWKARHFFGEFAQGAVSRSELGAPPVASNQVYKSVGVIVIANAKIGDLSTEVMRVRTASIGAVIGRRDDRRQHLTLTAAQR